MRVRARSTPVRLRVALVCVLAFVALLVAAVRPPTLSIVCASGEAVADRHGQVTALATSAAPVLRVPGARPARGDLPSADGLVGPALVARAPSLVTPPAGSAADVRFPSPRAFRPRAKARAELMVFLN